MSSDMSRRSFLGTLGLLGAGSIAALGQSSIVGAEADAPSSAAVDADATAKAAIDVDVTRPLGVDGWTQYNANAANTGHHAVDAPRVGFETTWKVSVGEVRVQPAVVGDTLYVAVQDNAVGPGAGRLRAVDAADGSVKWTVETAQPEPPAAAEDTVYVSDSYGLHALDASDGSEQWTFARGEGAEQSYGESLWSETGEPASAPALTDAAVFVSLPDTLYALNRTDGSVLWKCEIDNPDTNGVYTRGVPAVGAETVYFTAGTDDDQTVYAVDAATGEKRWTAPGHRTPVAVDDAVVIRTGIEDGEALVALDGQTGEERWRFETGHVSMPAADEDTVYAVVGFSTNSLVALDAETGEERWRQTESRGDYPFFVDEELVVTDDTIYLGSHEGLLTLDKEGGAFIDTYAYTEADSNAIWPTVVADGTVYGSDVNPSGDDNHLYALGQGGSDGAGEPDEGC